MSSKDRTKRPDGPILNKSSEQIVAEPAVVVPKFCTNINFKQLKSGLILMNFIFKTDDMPSSILINTIIIDEEHAKSLVATLSRVLSKESQ